jgi:probable rRNA maturation factor
MQESIRKNDFDVFNKEVEAGDILICHDVCLNQAKDFSIGYQDEFIHLFVHGLLHLFGYDHELSNEEDKIMRGLEDQILKELKSRRACTK